MAWLCCCNSFDGGEFGIDGCERGAVQLLLELGQSVVQLAIVKPRQACINLPMNWMLRARSVSENVAMPSSSCCFCWRDSLSLASCPVTAAISFIVQVALLSLSFLYRPATVSQ